MGPESNPSGFVPLPELDEIVDFPVEHENIAPTFHCHGLAPHLRKILDAEAIEAEETARQPHEVLVVRSAVGLQTHHADDPLRRQGHPRIPSNDTGDSAHYLPPCLNAKGESGRPFVGKRRLSAWGRSSGIATLKPRQVTVD